MRLEGLPVNKAFEFLNYSNKKASQLILKVLESAVANAEHNNSSDLDELIVKNVLVDEGPYGKRHRPRARGRVNQIIKRTSHITIVVSDGQEEKNNGTKSTSNRFQIRYFYRVHL